MRGDNHVLAVTTKKDEVTGEVTPLFYFPVQVCAAVEAKEVKFDIAGPSGAPRKQAFLDSGTGELIGDDECLRGVRIGDEFKPIEQEAIDAIKEATEIRMMMALGTVDFDQIPWDRSTGTYFIQSPAKGGLPKSYRILYEALLPVMKGKTVQRKAKAIVTKRTARSRQKLCVIYADPTRGCLMMQELRFASALREPDEQVLAPQTAAVEDKQVEMARQVVDGLGDGFAAIETEVDEAMSLRQELIEQAVAGETIHVPTPVAESAATTDLTAMLEASLAAA